MKEEPSAHLKAVCPMNREVKSLENLKRQEIVVREGVKYQKLKFKK